MPSDLPTASAGALEPVPPAGLPAEAAAPAAFPADDPVQASSPPRKGPLSFLTGALTSGLLAWVCLGLSARVVGYYAEHPPHYEAQFAQSIATAMKTLIVGMCFLATFSFAFIGVGLLLTFLRSLRPALRSLPPAASGRPS
jgi:Protein of unknown function (DUF3082)